MIQILPASNRKSFGEKANNALGAFFNQYNEMQQQKQQALAEERLNKLTGMDLSGFSPDLKKIALAEALRSQGQPKTSPQISEFQEENNLIDEAAYDQENERSSFNFNDPSSWSDSQIDKLRSIAGKGTKAKTIANRAQQEYEKRAADKSAKSKRDDAINPLNSALDVLSRMDQLGKGGNLGLGTSIRGVYSPKTRKDAAEYERLGKSLIQYSTNIPIRNRQEFEVLAHDLYDPTISDASREGILSAIRRIIENSINEHGGSRSESKQKPSLSSFLR